MDLELSAEQLALQEAVRDFLAAECPISLARQVVEDGVGGDELWQKMSELDWPAMAVSEDEGGLGMGVVELAIVSEQLGRFLAPVPFLSTASQFAPALRLAGTEEQRRRFLGPVAAEGMVGTLAIAESSGSFSPEDIRTEAVEQDGGWLLNGTKHFVVDGVRAQEIVVVARAPGVSREPTTRMFVVPQESVRSRQMENLDASRRSATIELDEVRVGDDRALSGAHGASVLQKVLDEATIALSAELVGVCQAMFDTVHSYVLEREQFGVKIGSFQAIKHKLADMFVALESASALCYFAALCVAEDDEHGSLAVSVAKSSAGDCQKLLAQQSIQCLGGIGYTWEHDIHLFVKRAKASGAIFGTAKEHRERVAQGIGLGNACDQAQNPEELP